MLDLKKIYIINENIVLRKIDNKFWALNIENGNQYRLNDVSYFILELLRKAHTFEEIILSIEKEYMVERNQLIEDCSLMIQTAIDKNILKEV